MNEETKRELIEMHQILQTIFVRGADVISMRDVLIRLANIIGKAEGGENE